MSINTKAMLVNLSIKQWSARKLDKAETAAVAAKHNTMTEVARVNKSLLPFQDKLEAVHKKSGEIRTYYYKHSLPWGVDGLNIIRSTGYQEFVAGMAKHMDQWNSMVRDFVDSYPQAVEDAKLLLNNLWRADDYPHVDDIARRFSIGVRFYPVPDAGDWRVDLSSVEKDTLRQQVEADTKASVEIAMGDAWRRVYEVVSKAHERLRDPKAVFRDTLVENARELCAMLPNLNLTDDPSLAAMGDEVAKSLCAHDPEKLRIDLSTRSSVSSKLADIERRLAGAYGR